MRACAHSRMDPRIELLIARYPLWNATLMCLCLLAAASLAAYFLVSIKRGSWRWEHVKAFPWPEIPLLPLVFLAVALYLCLRLGLLAVGLILCTAALYRFGGLNWRQQLGVGRLGWKRGFLLWLWLVPAMFGLLLPLMELVTWIWKTCGWPYQPQASVELFLQEKDPRLLAFFILMATVVAPISEELFFRGLAYPALKRRLGRLPALLAANLLFALVHQDGQAFLPLLALGMFWTILYERTGSLLLPMALHAAFNGMMALLLLALRQVA